MKLYIIYECDAHRSYDSMVIKWITNNKAKATKFFDYWKQAYVNDHSWFFNVGTYEVDQEDASDESNALRDISDLILTTEQ